MSDIEVRGLEDLARLSRAMRAAGSEGKGMRRQLRSEITRKTKKTRAEMRKSIAPALPKRGGLAADVVSKTRITAQTSMSGSDVGVRIRVRSKRSIRRMNNTGTFRHPVFGNRHVWVTQHVKQHFLDEPFEKSRPALRQAVLSTIARVRSDIYRSI